MHAYKVGSLYNPAVTEWDEASQYQYRSNAHELFLAYRHPSAAEVRSVEKGPCEFGCVEVGPVVFFLYRFGAADWSDCPYSYHLVPEGERTHPPETTGDERALLHTFLVNAASGVIKAMRLTSLSPEVTRSLHGMLTRQAMADWPGLSQYDRALADIYKTVPTSRGLLTLPGAVTCRGGS